jgi:hypothetical protein
MKVESAKYNQDTYDNSKNASINAVIDGQTWSVPLDSNNRHYAAILEWAEEDGNTIEEAD